MKFTNYFFSPVFFLRAVVSIVFFSLSLISYVRADTVVIPATGGNNLCVGGGYVTLGDITVKEQVKDDFKSEAFKSFVLVRPSANFEFKPNEGSVQLQSESGSTLDLLVPISVTATSITINFTFVGSDSNFDGFIISGIKVRAIGTADVGKILLKNPTNADLRKNSISDEVSHGELRSTLPVTITPVLSSSDVDNIICAGEEITFTASAPGANYYDFLVNGISVQNTTSPTYKTTTLTNGQTVTFKAYALGSCVNNSATSNSITTTVNSLPIATITSSDIDNMICSGQSVTFTAAVVAGASYEFFVDGVSVQNNGSHQYSTSVLTNNQVVKVKVSTGSCMATSTGITTTVNTPPVAALTSSDADNMICAGQSVTFTASPTSSATYEFFVGATSVQNGAFNKYITTSLNNGETVTVKVTTTNGCSASSTGITTTVNPLPSAILTSSDMDNTICAGESVVFTASPTAGATYEFFVNGVAQQDGLTNTYSTTSLANGETVTVSVTSASNCMVMSNAITTTVNPLPTVALTSSDADNMICAGESVTFTTASSIATMYEFFVNGTSVQSSASNKYTTTSLTNGQTVTVKATTASSCSASSTGITTTVNPLPVAVLTSSDADNVICAGESLTFTASPTAGANYEFFVNSSSVQNSASNTLSTTSLTNGQTVTVRVMNSNGCSITSTGITTTVNALPIVFLTSSDADNVICAGESVTFTANSNIATTYEFFVNGTSVQSSASNKYTTTSLTNGQTVTVKATTAGGCSASSTGITTTVNPLPVAVLTSSDADNVICTGQAVTFTASATSGATYEFFVNGVIKQTGTDNIFITPSLTNGQIITVRVINSNGCINISTGTVVTVQTVTTTLTSSDTDNVICTGESVTFTASANIASSYEFFVGGISVQNSASNTYITSSLTNGQMVTVKATTASNCSATSTGIITTVNPLPSATLVSSDSDNKICAGEPVTFTANSSIAATYEFFVDGVSVQNDGSNKYVTTSLANGQTVTVKVTTGSGCSTISTGILTIVNPLPSATLVSSDSDNKICAGESVTFTANSATATVYEFFADGVSVQNSASNTYTTSSLTNGQVVTVRVATANGCTTNSNSITTMVDNVSVSLTSNDADNIICPGETLTFTATSTTAINYEFFVNGVSVQSSSSHEFFTNTLTSGQTVHVRVKSSNNCEVVSNSITTTVTALVATLSSSDADNSICAGESVTFTVNAPTATLYEFFVDGISVQNSATNIYTTHTLTNGQTVTARATTASGCADLTNPISTNVNLVPLVTLTSSDADNNVCLGEQITFTASSATATTYEFFVNGVSVQNSTSHEYITANLTNLQTVTVKVTTGSGCSTISTGILTIVNPLPSATLVSSDSDNKICAGESVTFTANSATATVYEFFADGVSVQNSASNTYTTSSLTNGQVVTVRVATANGCTTNSNSITTMVDNVSVSLTSNDADNIICPGETLTFTATSTTAINYEFFVNGVSVQSSSSHEFFTNTLTSGQTVHVRVKSSNNCEVVSNSITTTVTALVATLSSSDADNSICAGESVTFTVNAPTATLYEFFVDGISVQNSATNIYTTHTLTNGQTVTARATTASGCADLTNPISTNVTTLVATLSSSDADNSICAGESVTFTVNAPTATLYEFFVDGISVQNSATNIYNAVLTNGQTVVGKAWTANGCMAVSNSITTTVNPLPTVTLISNDSDNSICAGESITFIANSPAATLYEFFVDGVSVQNSTTNIYTTNTLINGQLIKVKAATASGCVFMSNTITIIVNPLPTVTLVSSETDNTICIGESVTFTATSDIATTYEFFVDGVSKQNSATNTFATNSLTNGQIVTVKVTSANACSVISNSIINFVRPLPTVVLTSSDTDNTICAGESVTFTAASNIATNYKFYVDAVLVQDGASPMYVTSSLTNGQTVYVIVSTAEACSAQSSTIITTVNPLPTVTLVSSDTDNTICVGESVTFTAASNIATNYKFYVDAVLVQDGASPMYVTSSLTNGQTVYVIVSTAEACSVISNGITTVVNPLPTVTLVSSDTDNTICAGESVTFTATSDIATTYEFFVDGVSKQNSATNIFTTNNLTNGQIVTVKVTSANACSVISNGITTVVNPLPTVTLVSSDTDNTICAGESVTFTATSDIATTYEFFVDGVSKQNSATNIFTTNNLTNGQIVTVKVTSANACSVISNGITTVVNPLPTVTLVSSDTDNTICAGESVTFTAASNIATNYKFYVDAVLVQDGASPMYVTSSLTNGQTVTVRAATPSACSVISNGITTVVNPLPTVTLVSSDTDNTICAGESVTFTAASNIATNYKFYVDAVLVQDGASPMYVTSSLTNGQTVTVRAATPSACSVISNGITTVVNPLPTVTLVSSDTDNTICAGESVTFTATSDIATTYEFFVDGVSKQNSATNTFATNNLTNGQIVTVKVTSANACSVISNGITTVVNPLPTVTLVSSDTDNTICAGESVTFTATSDIATTYEFFVDGVSKRKDASNQYTISSLTNGQIVTVRVTSANGCSIASNGITTTVNSVAYANAGSDKIICANSVVSLSGMVGGSASNGTWSGGKGNFSNPTDLNTTYLPDPSEWGKTIILVLTTDDADGTGPCNSVSDEIRITINALPVVDFSGLSNGYCIDAASVSLTGFPTGGFFSGPGINGSSFNPSQAGAGSHTITYTFTDVNNCTNSEEKTVVVYSLPSVSFSGFNNIGPGGVGLYSFAAQQIDLVGSPTGGVFSGKGITGSSFTPAQAGSGTHSITYTFIDENGCTNFQTQSVVVEPLPSVMINNPGGPYCSNADEIILVGFPAGGTFSGPGIRPGTSIFKPSVDKNGINPANVGANIIRYTFTDALGGTNYSETSITVNQIPSVTFSINNSYCIDGADVNLSGFPADNDGPGGIVGTFSGPGIVPGTSVFRPADAGTGNHTIRYTFTDVNGCTNYTERTVVINEKPLVTFSGLGNMYCLDASAVALTGFPVGGTFSGPGISGASFVPSLAGVGSHKITYTYTNNNGCTNIQEQIVKVSAVPVANFNFAKVCDKDSVQFTDVSSVGNGENIQSWEWHFGDALSGDNNTSLLQHPTHQYSAPGNYTVTLKVTTESGCTAIKTTSLTIGGIPEPDFTWTNICNGEATLFTHQTSLSFGSVTTWEWDFGDGNKKTFTNGADKVSHEYTNPGKYQVTLHVITNFSCSRPITKEIYILPAVSVYPYLENFETGTGGWITDGVSSSWRKGKPAGSVINKAASGDNAWMTGLDTTYNANEQSYVYSPCFDFTGFKRPMMALQIWSHTQKGFDGVVLQASVDGGANWQTVGNMNEGLEWYNQSAIIGNPGGQAIGQVGWSGQDSVWRSAKYALDEFKGNSSVRFRMAFGSNQDNPANEVLDGFAFDDVYIYERDRIVLLEHFTNSSNQEAKQENIFISNLTDVKNEEAIDIQYHTNFPGSDPFNETNTADPSARALYYGVPQTPRTALDGYIENEKFSQWGAPMLKKRKLVGVPFTIEIDFSSSPANTLNVSAKITAGLQMESNVFVHIAVIEKEVNGTFDGFTKYENVLRKMLPDAAGTRFTKIWLPGETETVNQSWEVVHVEDPGQLAVIVFIQDEQTKEIYQAAISKPAIVPQVITAVEDEVDTSENILLYPNPTSQQTQVIFKQALSTDTDWVVYDLLGRIVTSGIVKRGQQKIVLNTSTYAEGSYLIQIKRKGKAAIYKRLVVIHK